MLTLRKAGIFTTIQDNGRFFGAHLGIPISGAMDSQSANIANLILGNNMDDALLECTFVGPTIYFHSPTLISIVGAITPTFLNGNLQDTSKAIPISRGDTLSFGRIEKGCRFYIGVKGGILSKMVYKSRSACITGNILSQLKNGDKLMFAPHTNPQSSSVSMKRFIGNNILQAFEGPEYAILNDINKKEIFNSRFLILPQSNRMAYRIEHSIHLSHSHSMLSSGTLPGTIQMTPSGDLIFLMRDTQTTGGYPRILQLTEQSINDLSQLRPGEFFTLKIVC